jgi:hypothetical protein
MPTPSDHTPHLTASALPEESQTSHTTCPPEIERGATFTGAPEERIIEEEDDDDDVLEERAVLDAAATELPADRRISDATSLMMDSMPHSSMKQTKSDGDVVMGYMSPVSATSDGKEEQSSSPPSQTSSAITGPSASSSINYEFSNIRVSNSPVRFKCCRLMKFSYSPVTPPPFSEPEANSKALSSRTVRSTM